MPWAKLQPPEEELILLGSGRCVTRTEYERIQAEMPPAKKALQDRIVAGFAHQAAELLDLQDCDNPHCDMACHEA